MPYQTLTKLTILFALLSVLVGCSSADRQRVVADRGQAVMPFDLDRTTHHFTSRTDGLLQEVIADDPDDAVQRDLIRQHLRAEVQRFKGGDFGDPARIHGEQMPGLRQLEAGATSIDIRYREVGAGAQIEFLTADPALIASLHLWGAAQVKDHGRHAK